MSCKRIQAAESRALAVLAWRPGAMAAPAIAPAKSDAAAPDAKEIESRVQAAYQQGHAEGESAGAQRAAERLEPAIAAFNRIANELATLRKRFRAEVEEDTVKLAIAIARRVLHREIATDPEAILGLVMAAFHKLNARETRRLRAAPADAALISQHRAKLSIPEGLEICADASLAAGSVVFETSRGEMDASIDTQLGEIERGFADIVKRRTR
ncbi:MAG TPA: FliH/SctL family protein [Bryobacteraceae bacterium]|jgi:flagellar assembly protein FliH|nr:FliH/SctL family protein [Bryobacteraceae bacterium]